MAPINALSVGSPRPVVVLQLSRTMWSPSIWQTWSPILVNIVTKCSTLLMPTINISWLINSVFVSYPIDNKLFQPWWFSPPHSWQFMQFFQTQIQGTSSFGRGTLLEFFKRTVCDYKAKQQFNAIRHVKFIHLNFSENLYCQICQKNYSRNANYIEHVRTVHRGNSSLMGGI